MQIVIEISEERYQDIQRIAEVQTEKRMLTCEQIIANGTPLPEHHGRLIIDERGNIFEESTGKIILQRAVV